MVESLNTKLKALIGYPICITINNSDTLNGIILETRPDHVYFKSKNGLNLFVQISGIREIVKNSKENTMIKNLVEADPLNVKETFLDLLETFKDQWLVISRKNMNHLQGVLCDVYEDLAVFIDNEKLIFVPISQIEYVQNQFINEEDKGSKNKSEDKSEDKSSKTSENQSNNDSFKTENKSEDTHQQSDSKNVNEDLTRIEDHSLEKTNDNDESEVTSTEVLCTSPNSQPNHVEIPEEEPATIPLTEIEDAQVAENLTQIEDNSKELADESTKSEGSPNSLKNLNILNNSVKPKKSKKRRNNLMNEQRKSINSLFDYLDTLSQKQSKH